MAQCLSCRAAACAAAACALRHNGAAASPSRRSPSLTCNSDPGSEIPLVGLGGLRDLAVRACRRGTGGQHVVLAVRVRCGELGGGHGLDAVLEEDPRESLAEPVAPVALAPHSAGVLGGLDLERTPGLVLDAEPALVVVERSVDLDVLAVGEPHY